MSVRDVDHGYRAFKKHVEEIKTSGVYARVGVFSGDTDNARDKGAVTNVDLAVIHEFGSPAAGVPERSWLRSAFDLFKDKWGTLADKLAGRIVDGKLDVEKALDMLGMTAAADVKKHITSGDGIPPPNAPSTIARKGSSRPLIDTSQFLNSITHDVVARGDSGE